MNFLPRKKKSYPAFLFSDKDLKIAKLNSSGKQLDKFFQFPVPEGVIVESEVKDTEKFNTFLKQVKEKTKIKDSIVVGLSEVKASTHSLTLPPLDISEIDQAIKFQAESFLPFPYKSEYLDWMLIEKTEKGENRILLTAVPRNIIDNYIACLDKAGFKPIAFETTSLSLFRLIPPEGKKLSFAAEIDEPLVVLILGHRGNIEACSIIRSISQFIDTIGKMKSFYLQAEEKQSSRQKIYLCGKKLTENLIKEIKEKLEMESVLLKTGVDNIPGGKEAELAVLLSLARKKVAPPKDEKTINILPFFLAEKYEKLAEEKIKSGLGIFLTLLLLFFNLLVFLSYFSLKTKTAQIGDQEKDLTNQQRSLNLSDLEAKAELINSTTNQQVLLKEVLSEIFKLSSPEMKISGLSFTGQERSFALTGLAKTRPAFLEFKEELEKRGIFEKITIPLSSLEREKEIEFRINLTVK